MKQTKEIKLLLDMANERDREIYEEIKKFEKKHHITNESDALKSFMIFLHFIGSDIRALDNKIKKL